jgi:hypothetical protein
MAYGYAVLDPPIKLPSEAFRNPFGLEHLDGTAKKEIKTGVDECLSLFPSPLTSLCLSLLSLISLLSLFLSTLCLSLTLCPSSLHQRSTHKKRASSINHR